MTKPGAQISGFPVLEVGPVLRTPANLTQTYPIRQVFCKSVSDPTCTLQCKSAILTKFREGSRSFGSGPFAKLRRWGDPTRFAEIDTEISGFISGRGLGRAGVLVAAWSPGCRVYVGFGRIGGVLQLESPLPLDTQLTFSVEHRVRSDRAPASAVCDVDFTAVRRN